MTERPKCENCGMTATQVYRDTPLCDWCKKGREHVDGYWERVRNP